MKKMDARTNTSFVKTMVALMCCAALALTSVLYGCSSNQSAASSSAAASSSSAAEVSAPKELPITLVVEDANNEGVTLYNVDLLMPEGSTVYDAIVKAQVTADIQDGEYGKYITSINGIAAEGNSGWVYTINGNEVMESIDSAFLNDGDAINISYVTF